MEQIRAEARRLTVMAMMLAMISALSMLEHALPPIPGLPPGVRFGLANIVTMYALFFIGRRAAVLLTVLKAVFVLLMRGATAGLLSLCGGLLAIIVIILLMLFSRDKPSYLILSIAGAVMHNLGQISMAAILLGSVYAFFYLPVLIVSGVVMGSVTSTLLCAVMPLFHRILHIKPKNIS